MGGAAKFFMLLTTPFPLVRPRPSLLRSISISSLPHTLSHVAHHHVTLSPSSSHNLGFVFCSKFSSRRCLHVQSVISDDRFSDPNGQSSPAQRATTTQPWPPEWSRLIDVLASWGYFDRHRFDVVVDQNEFVSVEGLPDDFVRVAHSCLALAHDRPNLLGFLSRKDIEVVVENGKPFLFKSSVESTSRMRSFLGSGGSHVLECEMAHTVDLMRFLLSYMSNPNILSESSVSYNRELVESSVRNLLSELAQVIHSVPEPDPSASAAKQFPGRYGQRSRPLGQNKEMKRGDWICTRCNFMNFARNVKCFECKEARPQRQLTGGEWECPQCDYHNFARNMICLRCECKRPKESFSPSSGLGYGNTSYVNKVDNRFASNDEKEERWLKKVSSLDSSYDMESAIADKDFPEIIPLRKGVNRFVVSTRKTPLERRQSKFQYQSNLGHHGTSEGNNVLAVHKNLDPTITRELDEILGRTRASPDTDSKGNSAAGTQNLPPVSGPSSEQFGLPEGSSSSYVPSVPLPSDMFAKKSQESKTQQEGGKLVTNNYEAAASRADRQSPISRSNEYSKSGESLTSESVPKFVPFPPDYFAQKGQPTTHETRSGEEVHGNSFNTSIQEKPMETSDAVSPGVFNRDHGQWRKTHQTGVGRWNMRSSEQNLNERTSNQDVINPQTNDRDSIAHFGKENTTQTPNAMMGDSTGPTKNENAGERWAGKSSEGSAAKEQDPSLDMSEEAKTERWFRRVAQIKDISELSQIPDEDFPSIMPMRKGVNRFVVSKRKTPLERRLTSAQYRRDLPVASLEPVKKEDDGS